MIDAALKVLSNLVKLAEVREKNREKFIDRYVEPAYRDAEVIYKDYSELMREIESKLKRARKTAPLLKYLEQRRRENLTIRTKTRAMIRELSERESITRFERGIMGLMMGSVTSFDDGYWWIEPISLHGDHTVLNFVKYLKKKREKSDIEPFDRQELMRIVQEQIKGLDLAWQEVVSGYAELKSEIVPKTAIRNKHRI